MIRPGVVFGLFRAEARLTRRLVRFWLFQVLATLVGSAIVLYYSFLHKLFSSWSGTAAMLNPRYLMGFLGIYYVVFLFIGLVFLGYDLRARDRRERIVEVVDSLPFSNLELMLGRFLGILIPSWLPVILICVILWAIAKIMGASLAPISLIGFALFLTLPAYCFTLGLTFLITTLVRHRLIAAICVIGLLVGLIVVNFAFVPVFMLPLVDLTGGFSAPTPSDLTPTLIDSRGFLQRAGFLLMGIGMLWLATAVHPRKDDAKRSMTALAGAAMIGIGGLALGWLTWEGHAAIQQKIAWTEIHESRRSDPAPDLLEIGGTVRVDPGKRITMDLALRIAASGGADLNTALFSLNPGLEVQSVTGDGGPLSFESADGLLDVQLDRPLAAGQETTLQLQVEGVPDWTFAYLDSVVDPLAVNIRDGNIFILGFRPAIFDDDYVVLLPGARWLPASGAEIGRGDPDGRPFDFFEIDLTVDVPDETLVAGPGRRREAEGAEDGRARFRFAPEAPLPDVALVVGPLASRSVDIDGVLLEVLVHPDHEKNLEFFEDAAVEIEDWLTEHLEEADEVGLTYPYDGLTLVEVPGELRGYSGGWRMDSTFAQPGMIFMRESGFPTANFAQPFQDPEDFRDQEGGIQRAKRERLEQFFENDFSGGNPFVAAARNFFSFQTTGSGSIGLPMDFVCSDLSTRLVTDKQGYFSVHHFGRDINSTINQTVQSLVSNQGASVSDALIDTVTSRSEVWDQVLEVSLDELDPWDAPKRTLDVLTLKGGAMSRSMLDELGREKTGEVLAALREGSTGEAYSRDDVLAAGIAVDVDLAEWLDVWIGQTELPGFTIGRIRYERISDGEDGAPRYQALVTLRNEESTAGLLRVEHLAGEPDPTKQAEKGEPVRVPGHAAVEIGVVTSEPLRMLRVVPYLALNRKSFAVDLPALDEESIGDAEPFLGVREVPWEPEITDAIVVDDLDEGFSVEQAESRSFLRFGGKGVKDEDTDQGLPLAQLGRPATRWTRRIYPSAFGKYRHTWAQVRAGKGEKQAVFATEIPRAGEWELEYYIPAIRQGPGSRTLENRGTWSLTVIDPSGSQEVNFNAADADAGWNTVGTFDIADGETRVVVTDQAEGGRIVLADAIRWVPVSSGSEGVATP